MNKHIDTTKNLDTAKTEDSKETVETVESVELDSVTGGCPRCGCGLQPLGGQKFPPALWYR